MTEAGTGPHTAAGSDPQGWTGTWVAERLGVRLEDEGLRGLLGLALRRNPKRAHLLVSTVLGKHVPQRPSAVLGAGRRLGERVRERLGAAEAARSVVLGFAETATGLGLTVAHGMGSRASALHSTRRPVPGVARYGGFEEEHSHATSHLLLPEDPDALRTDGPLVLVDDELSTGRTVRNTVAALHAVHPRDRYVVAALVDTRGGADVAALEKFAAELGARIDVVALAAGRVGLPDDVLERGRELVAAHRDAPHPAPPPEARGAVRRVEPGWPQGVPDGARHGFGPREQLRLEAALPGMAARVLSALDCVGAAPADGAAQPDGPDGAPPRVLVLGSEELMYAPLLLAAELERRTEGRAEIRFSTTTRSPVLAVDDPGYAIRTALRFPAHDLPHHGGPAGTDSADSADSADDGTGPDGPHGPVERYAYNIAGQGFDAVVAVVDSVGDTPALHAPGGLLDQLAGCVPEVALAVVPSYVPDGTGPRLPAPLHGPAFSSYAHDEVAWLLRDLSDVELEAPTEEREEAIQAGGAHYAESLPVEYQPSAEYQRLFHDALESAAERLARAVGTVLAGPIGFVGLCAPALVRPLARRYR
ncbi:phosphoribosyltransferase domain-containing protein, partial [Streptomyces sp. NPDC006992]|uniref:phosphoribosyltransferase family protein n=1 Tax=Streptomyces sp. NPDC006992 TaxID=3155601 RepID=UPI0033D448B6